MNAVAQTVTLHYALYSQIPADVLALGDAAVDAKFAYLSDAEFNTLSQATKDDVRAKTMRDVGWIWLRAGVKQGNGSCKRCGGFGFLAAYRHVQSGVCFKCGGTGEKSCKK